MGATLSKVNALKTGGVSPSATHPLSNEEPRKINAYWRRGYHDRLRPYGSGKGV
jgi:hypothetical protein